MSNDDSMSTNKDTMTPELVARTSVIAIAKSQLGVANPTPYWIDAFGSYPGKQYSWCGVFALWCLRQAKLTDWKWITGKGFIFVGGKQRLPNISRPAIGDIAYFTQFQHYALVESVDADLVHLIAGNTPSVSESVVPLSKAAAYYSIAPLLQSIDLNEWVPPSSHASPSSVNL